MHWLVDHPFRTQIHQLGLRTQNLNGRLLWCDEILMLCRLLRAICWLLVWLCDWRNRWWGWKSRLACKTTIFMLCLLLLMRCLIVHFIRTIVDLLVYYRNLNLLWRTRSLHDILLACSYFLAISGNLISLFNHNIRNCPWITRLVLVASIILPNLLLRLLCFIVHPFSTRTGKLRNYSNMLLLLLLTFLHCWQFLVGIELLCTFSIRWGRFDGNFLLLIWSF